MSRSPTIEDIKEGTVLYCVYDTDQRKACGWSDEYLSIVEVDVRRDDDDDDDDEPVHSLRLLRKDNYSSDIDGHMTLQQLQGEEPYDEGEDRLFCVILDEEDLFTYKLSGNWKHIKHLVPERALSVAPRIQL